MTCRTPACIRCWSGRQQRQALLRFLEACAPAGTLQSANGAVTQASMVGLLLPARTIRDLPRRSQSGGPLVISAACLRSSVQPVERCSSGHGGGHRRIADDRPTSGWQNPRDARRTVSASITKRRSQLPRPELDCSRRASRRHWALRWGSGSTIQNGGEPNNNFIKVLRQRQFLQSRSKRSDAASEDVATSIHAPDIADRTSLARLLTSADAERWVCTSWIQATDDHSGLELALNQLAINEQTGRGDRRSQLIDNVAVKQLPATMQRRSRSTPSPTRSPTLCGGLSGTTSTSPPRRFVFSRRRSLT